MKQFLSLLLAAALTLALAGCGASSSQPQSSAEPESAPPPESAAVSSAEPESAASPSGQPQSPSSAPSSEPASAPSSAPTPPAQSAPQAPSSSASEAESSPPSSEPVASEPAPAAGDDLSKSIGPSALNPGNGDTVGIGLDQLLVLVPRVGVVGGDAALTVYDAADDSEFVSLNLSESGTVEYLDWTEENDVFDEKEGTALLIDLGQALEGGHSYYITAEEGWLTMPEEGILAKPISGKKDWAVRVADYGIDYDTQAYSVVAVDQSVTFHCTVGEAAKAKISLSPKDAAELSEKELSQDGEVTVTFKKRGSIQLTVSFYDEKGGLLSDIVQRITCK